MCALSEPTFVINISHSQFEAISSAFAEGHMTMARFFIGPVPASFSLFSILQWDNAVSK